MNRVEAKSIIDAGKNVLKLLVSQGGSSNTPLAWLANWENIKAFSAGADIKVRGVVQEFPRFINEVGVYKVVSQREIDWLKVLENGGYGVELTNPSHPKGSYRLVGVCFFKYPIIEKMNSGTGNSAMAEPYVCHRAEIKDPSLIQESWYAEEDS